MMAHEIKTLYSFNVHKLFFFLGLHGLNEAILKTESLGKIRCVLIVLKDLNHIWAMGF